MMRAVAGVLLVALVLGGCTGGSAPEPTSTTKQVTKREKPPRPPHRAAAAKFESNLNVKHIRGCLYDSPVDISVLAPNYYSPQDLVIGEVEKARDLDIDVPEIRMLEKKAFAHELRKSNLHLTSEQKKINRWLDWNLGYAPFSSRAKPDGDGAELVAGFYTTRGRDIVINQEGELDSEYFTLAHELAHAADDQHFGLPRSFSRRTIDDESLAADALVEGAATLVELRLESLLGKQKLVNKGINELLTSKIRFKKDRDDGVLHSATDRYIFPYRWGVAFVCSIFRKEGWKGVNRAFRNPPVSTAEVMFPKRFLERDRPRNPPKFSKPPKNWKLFAKGTIGSAHLKALFEAPSDQTHRALGNPLGRAAAWDGGIYRIWARKVQGVNSIFGMSFAEHKGHEDVLCSSMIKWYEETFRLAQREVIADDVVAFDEALRGGVIDCRGRNVQVAIGPSVSAAKSIVDL